ncbi:MAG: hypothetical protein KDC35_19350 [Acidobacteria bacterium]|nr:hypothetical protein [Acidobacteriota bacterium]
MSETLEPTSLPAEQPKMTRHTYRSVDPRTKSPFLAAFLSLIPGLGQVYVGYYQRGFTHPIVVGLVIGMLIVAGDQSRPPFYFPLGIIFLIFFWLYNIIDAWRRAIHYNLALEGLENIPLPNEMGSPTFAGSMFGGAAFFLIGFVILLHTRFGLPLEVLEEWWPVVPMAFGGYLFYMGWRDKHSK